MSPIEKQIQGVWETDPTLKEQARREHAALGQEGRNLTALLDSKRKAGDSGRLPETDWPDPVPIQSELPPVKPFDENLLPESFRPLVVDVAERMQVPMDYPAAAIVLCLAGCVSRRAVIQPKENDSSWVVVPNLWGGIIAPPGMLKSPVLRVITHPLTEIQSAWFAEHENGLSEFEVTLEENQLKHAAWKEEYKRSIKQSDSRPERPEDPPEKPTLKRLIVNDSTFEKLHEMMGENPAGILVIRDELTGWWSTLDRAGREGERSFCLEAWNGDHGKTVDRIGRGTIYVEACCMSMLGGIQPGRLRGYLVDALADGPSNDGLIQRFQVMVWPDTDKKWELVDRPPDPGAEGLATEVFRVLVALPVEDQKRLKFSPEAQELFNEWQAELEAKVRGDELHPALISHLSKYRSLMPSLALLFELADWAAGKGGGQSVSLEHTKLAAAWCDYLESHARRIYSCVTTPQLRAARELAGKIKKRKLPKLSPEYTRNDKNIFSCRDVYIKGWSGLDSPEAVRLAAEVLEDADWIRELPSNPLPTGGRPSIQYEINPGVWQ